MVVAEVESIARDTQTDSKFRVILDRSPGENNQLTVKYAADKDKNSAATVLDKRAFFDMETSDTSIRRLSSRGM